MSAKLACGLSFDFDVVDTVSIAEGTFCRTMSEAKTVEAERRMKPENRAKLEASVLIISISTKTMVELFLALGNKNLRAPSRYFCRVRSRFN